MFSTVPVKQIKVATGRQRSDLGDLEDLKQSIIEVGQINPIVVDDDYNLIAGERRYTAIKELGLDLIAVQRLSDLDPIQREQIELDENIKRKDLTWQEHTRALARYHELCLKSQPSDWTQEDTAAKLGVSHVILKRNLRVARALEEGDPLVLEAPKFSVAHGIVERKAERSKSAESDKLDSLLAGPSPKEKITKLEISTDSLDEDDTETVLDSRDWAPIECASFNEWAPDYTGPKFNFIHCDFPYGINADKHDQGSSKDFGGYADGEEVYWELLESLAGFMETGVAQSAHLMFWFSMNSYSSTKAALEAMGWKVNPHPLIWHKIDNSGVLPDPRRMPRQIYEACFLASRGDRFLVKPKSNAIAFPNQKTIHMSEKPVLMLDHFFQMLVDETTYMLDPTCGSGNSVIATIALGGRAYGLEVNDSFANAATENYYQWKEKLDAAAQKQELTAGINL